MCGIAPGPERCHDGTSGQRRVREHGDRIADDGHDRVEDVSTPGSGGVPHRPGPGAAPGPVSALLGSR